MGCPCSAATNPRQRQDAAAQSNQPAAPVGSGRGYRWTGPRAAKNEPPPPAEPAE